MKTRIKLLGTALVLFVLISSAVGDHSIDPYKTIKIANQIWMAENLNESHFRNGEDIPEAKTNEEWIQAGKESNPAWCYYENKIENGPIYGKLYNWYAVHDPRGLAPEGWHMSSDSEWRQVTDYLGGEDAAGTKMKSSSGWIKNGNGTNESGFEGLPGGSRDMQGEFSYVEQIGYWWTSTAPDNNLAWYRAIDQSPHYVYRTNYRKQNGLSVRCIKD